MEKMRKKTCWHTRQWRDDDSDERSTCEESDTIERNCVKKVIKSVQMVMAGKRHDPFLKYIWSLSANDKRQKGAEYSVRTANAWKIT